MSRIRETIFITYSIFDIRIILIILLSCRAMSAARGHSLLSLFCTRRG